MACGEHPDPEGWGGRSGGVLTAEVPVTLKGEQTMEMGGSAARHTETQGIRTNHSCFGNVARRLAGMKAIFELVEESKLYNILKQKPFYCIQSFCSNTNAAPVTPTGISRGLLLQSSTSDLRSAWRTVIYKLMVSKCSLSFLIVSNIPRVLRTFPSSRAQRYLEYISIPFNKS